MFDFFQNNPVIATISFFTGIAGVFLSIFLYIIGKSKKQISFSYLHSDTSNYTVFFIWNSGNQMLDKEDFVATRPLRIMSKGAEVLNRVDVIAQSEKTERIGISKRTKRRIDFEFDYINPGDGIAVMVTHTGTPDDFTVDGIIKGGEKMRFYDYYKNRDFRREVVFPVLIVLFMVAICLSMEAVIGILSHIFKTQIVLDTGGKWILGLFMFLIWSAIATFIFDIIDSSHYFVPFQLKQSTQIALKNMSKPKKETREKTHV